MTVELERTATSGRAAVLAGVLMTAGIEGEWLLDPQRDDGTVTDLWAYGLLVGAATVGFALLTLAVRELRRASDRSSRTARAGGWLTLAGAGCLTVFGISLLVSGLLLGAPWEASFLAFALGMLLLVAGPVTWGLALRRRPPGSGLPALLTVAGVAAALALLAPGDPWHDLGLVAMFASWVGIGILLLRRRTDQLTTPAGRRTTATAG